MKKIFSVLLSTLLLLSCLSIFTIALKPEDAEVQFHIEGATGTPGDVVEVNVYLDKNPGIWACRFDVNFDSSSFKLMDVKNGSVFKDSQFTKSLLTNPGYYIYYSQMDKYNDVNSKTGLCLTLTFKILEVVNGNYPITVTYPDDGDGWFFHPDNLDESYTVATTNKATITVYGSSETGNPETDAEGLIVTKAPENTTEAITAILTDDNNEIVTDSNGNKETYIVTSGNISDVPQFVTDDEGNYVKDSEGNYETYYVDDKGNVIEVTTASPTSPTTNTSNVKIQKIILIISIALVVLASIVIVIVVTKSKKSNKTESNNSNINNE